MAEKEDAVAEARRYNPTKAQLDSIIVKYHNYPSLTILRPTSFHHIMREEPKPSYSHTTSLPTSPSTSPFEAPTAEEFSTTQRSTLNTTPEEFNARHTKLMTKAIFKNTGAPFKDPFWNRCSKPGGQNEYILSAKYQHLLEQPPHNPDALPLHKPRRKKKKKKQEEEEEVQNPTSPGKPIDDRIELGLRMEDDGETSSPPLSLLLEPGSELERRRGRLTQLLQSAQSSTPQSFFLPGPPGIEWEDDDDDEDEEER